MFKFGVKKNKTGEAPAGGNAKDIKIAEPRKILEKTATNKLQN